VLLEVEGMLFGHSGGLLLEGKQRVPRWSLFIQVLIPKSMLDDCFSGGIVAELFD
jgi:hypothetical protein